MLAAFKAMLAAFKARVLHSRFHGGLGA